MMQPKAKLYRFRASSAATLFESRSCLLILGLNWLMQGMRGMDPKELSFRLLLLAGMTAALAWPAWLATGVAPLTALAAGLLVAHTLNFLVNGQVWVCLRYCPFYRRDSRFLARELQALLDSVVLRPWLAEAVLLGSTVVRPAAPGPRADIDLRLIFPPGLAGWRRTNLLLLELRARALWRGLPLDVYAYEHPACLRRFDQSEPLGILLDRQARLRRGFANRQLVWLR
jgi:hypothetical protein